MDRELLALLDEDGHVVGAAPRGEVRRRNLRHAATAVLVRDGRGRVYLHRRTPDKDLFPGRYDVWAGGCVRAGEAPAEAARRELDEELGIVGARLAPLFTADYADECTRYRAYAYEVRWDGPVRHQPEEVAEGRWVGLDELRTRLADPAWPFVPDGRTLLEHWLAGAGEAERTLEARAEAAAQACGIAHETTATPPLVRRPSRRSWQYGRRLKRRAPAQL